MAEVVGIVKPILALIQLTSEAATLCYEYIGSAKNAGRELIMNELANELSSYTEILTTLLEHVESQGTIGQTISVLDSTFLLFAAEVEGLIERLVVSERRIASLKWPLKTSETLQVISRIQRHKNLFSLALDADKRSLTQAIHESVEGISATLKNTLATEAATQIKDSGVDSEALRTWRRQEDVLKATEKRRKVLHWIYPGDPGSDHIKFRSLRLMRTGDWIFESPEFCEWSAEGGGSRLLWVYGKAGCGKTILSSAVIDFLQSKLKVPSNRAASAHIYFHYTGENQLGDYLANLVKQLASQIPNLPQNVEPLYDEMEPQGKRPTAKQLYSALLMTKNSFQDVFFVFDGLDEYDPARRKTEILPMIHQMAEHGIRVFLTSRRVEDIELSLRGAPQIKVEPQTNSDIKTYIDRRIDNDPRLRRLIQRINIPSGYKTIPQIVEEYSGGAFWTAHVLMNSLAQQNSARYVLETLERFRNSTMEGRLLENFYENSLEKISNRGGEHASLAIRVFSWLMNAKRSFTVEELSTAVSIDGPDELDFSTVLEVCAGLVEVDETTHITRFAHPSIQEHLLNHRVFQNHGDTSFNIAISCCTLLSSDVFAQGACTSNKSLGDRFELYPLLDYAASHLSYHLESCDETLSRKPLLKFLGNPGSISSYLQAKSFRKQRKGELAFDQYPKGQVALHIASTVGHVGAVQALLDEAADISITDDDGQTALSLAASTGKELVVNLLLERGANISATDNDGWTALHWASYNGHEKVTLLLLSKGANISASEDDGKTPLSLAACGGFGEVVRLLLDNGGDPLATDKNGWTVLHWAAFGGDAAVVQLILDKGSEQSTLDRYGRTALSLAASEGFETVVLSLLNGGGNPLVPDKNGWTAMHWAASKGQVAVVKLLLERKVEPSILDKHRRTPLSLATSEGHAAVVKMLEISAATSPPLLDEDTRTRLFLETSKGNKAVVRSLLDNGESLLARDTDGRTLLHVAAWKGHAAIVELLLEKRADPSARAKDKTTALCIAAAYGHEKVVKLLLDHGADPRVVDGNGWTPLYRAVSKEHEAVVRLLIEKRTDPSASEEERDPIFLVAAQVPNDDAQPPPENRSDFSRLDLYERTPLYRAASKGHESIVRVLLKLKANLLGQAKDGRTILSVAAARGHDAVVQLLLDESLWPPASKMDAWIALSDKYGWTALHWAAAKGHENIFKSLLAKAKDFSGAAKDGRTLLSLAASEGHKSIVQMLLEKRAEVSTQDKYGRTPLYLAAAAGHEDVVKLLLENNANVSISDGYGRQPLHCAAFGGHQAVVQLLFRRGAFISAQDKRGQTPLYLAAAAGHKDMVKLLLENNANVSISDGYGRKPLHCAAFGGHQAVVQLLFTRGAFISAQDKRGQTPLHRAVSAGKLEMTQLLLNSGASISAVEKDGKTILSLAASEGHEKITSLLLQNGANSSTQDSFGRTPLYWAATEGHHLVVRVLLEKSADTSIKDRYGRTPLYQAASEGHETVVQLLLDSGANSSTKANNGKTALDRALCGGHTEVIRLLKTVPKTETDRRQTESS